MHLSAKSVVQDRVTASWAAIGIMPPRAGFETRSKQRHFSDRHEELPTERVDRVPVDCRF
jgi:hypothetical protein